MLRTRSLTLGLAVVIALSACDEQTADPLGLTSLPGDDPLAALLADASHEERGSTTTGAPRGTPPGMPLFERLAGEIPSFAGLYRVAQCSVVVVLTDREDVELAVRVVHAVVEPLVERGCPNGIRVDVAEGQYTYHELLRLLAAARPLFQIDGVYAIRIDYASNGLLITVRSRDVAAEVRAALPRVGIPGGAVSFALGGPPSGGR